MISQNCPVCHSSRIRRGYKPTRFWNKLIFRYNLLCDACNWEFAGFAIPLGGDYKSKKRVSNKTEQTTVDKVESEDKVLAASSQSKDSPKKIKKRARA